MEDGEVVVEADGVGRDLDCGGGIELNRTPARSNRRILDRILRIEQREGIGLAADTKCYDITG